jgi:type VI secretion system secreted protein VgrG
MFDLAFESGEHDLSVRTVNLREAVSSLFEVSLEAVSPSEDLSFDAIVGKGATLRIRAKSAAGPEATRVFRGVCRSIEQIRVEPSGLSTYAIGIVPPLWLLTQRTNHRLFQHLSALDIARALLGEWGITATFKVDEALHPRLELRVQYGESDFDFLCRVLEDAGVAFVFPNRDDVASVVLSDDLHALALAEPHETLLFLDNASGAGDRPHVTDVRVSRAVEPSQVTIGDHDFRRSSSFQLAGHAGPAGDRLEQYRYRPGAFLVDGTPSDPNARHEEKEGRAQAERALCRAQAATRVVSLRTNVVLTPGQAIAIRGHGRAELAPGRPLLITEVVTKGTMAGDVMREVRAGFVGPAEPWLPPARASRPRVHGVQSAVVVGPNGQEIHTDEMGRVRVQFPWDREGRFDEKSSCWIRVSQGWAGGAYGMIALPRVGQEVLVGFVDGDPDQPVVVGRVFNATSTVPYKLPEHATISAWKSASSPGADGSNEILFEDAKGGERLFVQAERDLERLVKRDSTTTIGNDRRAQIQQDDSLDVGGDRRARVRNADVTNVGSRHMVTVGARAVTGTEIVDGRITFTTGEATLTLDGPNVTLDAAAGILLKAAQDISLMAEANITARADVSLTLAAGSTLVVRSESGDVVIQGGPFVRINPEVTRRSALAAAGVDLPPDVPPGVDLDEDIALAEEHARFDPEAPSWLADRMKPGGPWDFGAFGAQFSAFASFHLGAVGAAMGFPEGALLHQAGARRQARGDSPPDWGDPGNGLCGGTYPYGADPRDQEMTRKGYAFYARRYGS